MFIASVTHHIWAIFEKLVLFRFETSFRIRVAATLIEKGITHGGVSSYSLSGTPRPAVEI